MNTDINIKKVKCFKRKLVKITCLEDLCLDYMLWKLYEPHLPQIYYSIKILNFFRANIFCF